MSAIEDVLRNYIDTKARFTFVPGRNETPALSALREGLPALFRQAISDAGLNPREFLAKGACGEPNRSFAKVPWVAVFKRTITTSATNGYYIVLLFSEDMSSAALTLNQGYTAFRDQYKYLPLVRRKLSDCAASAALLLRTPRQFSTGPVNLNASGELGQGYEAGSILSKTYHANRPPSDIELKEDVMSLLQEYQELSTRYSTSLLELDVSVTDSDYQQAVQAVSANTDDSPATAGPQPRPPLAASSGSSKFARSPEVAGRVISMAR